MFSDRGLQKSNGTPPLPGIAGLSVRDQRATIMQVAEDREMSPNERFQLLACYADRLFANRYSLTPVSAGVVAILAHRMAKVYGEGTCQLSDDVCQSIATIADVAIELVRHLDGQGLSNVAWAFGAMELHDDGLFNAIARQAVGIIDTFNPQELSNTVCAFARLGIKNDRLLRAVNDRVQSRKLNLSPRDICDVAWAFAELGIDDDSLYEHLARKAREKITQFKVEDRAVCGHAFAVFRPDLVSAVCSPENLTQCDNNGYWIQLYHSMLVAGLISPKDSYPRLSHITPSHGWKGLNGFEQDVHDWLINDVGVPAESISLARVVVGIETDFVLEGGRRPVIVECDGDRHHLTRGPNGGTRFGHDRLQDSIFRACGYEVVHLRDSELYAEKVEAIRKRIVSLLQAGE